MNPICFQPVHACALAQFPATAGTDLPRDIQVFPPGDAVEFTLQDHPGERFTMRVDASVAARAQADLEKLLARANAGQGPKPFADKNHEDAEATFHPKRFFWGGDDPKAGGVRVEADWTGFGASLARARAFCYFSGNFLFDKVRKQFLGLINENIGGLVNRPGFATQQAFAKAGAVGAPETAIEVLESVDQAASPVVSAAEIARLAKKYGLDLSPHEGEDATHPFQILVNRMVACGVAESVVKPMLARDEPELYASYMHHLTGYKGLMVVRREWDEGTGEYINVMGKAAPRSSADDVAGNEQRLSVLAIRRAVHHRSTGLPQGTAYAIATCELRAVAKANYGRLPRDIDAPASKAFFKHAQDYYLKSGLGPVAGIEAFARTEPGQFLLAQV